MTRYQVHTPDTYLDAAIAIATHPMALYAAGVVLVAFAARWFAEAL